MAKLRIGIAETVDFINWCHRTLAQRSNKDSIRPYNFRRDALVFSFDVDLNLFLGNSYGWNREEQRTYFSKRPAIMDRISQITWKFGRENGGRVFLDNTRLFYVDRASQERKLCDLVWPRRTDVVDEVRRFWLALPRRSYMTIRLPGSRRTATPR
jgi:hypothetical protein